MATGQFRGVIYSQRESLRKIRESAQILRDYFLFKHVINERVEAIIEECDLWLTREEDV